MITVQVTGLEEIKKGLQSLPGKIAQKVLRKGVYAGAALLRGAIRQAAPSRTAGREMKMSSGGTRLPGYLKKHIGAKFRKGQGMGAAIYRVAPFGQAFYGNFVEQGHAAGKRKKYGLHVTAATGLKMVPAHPFIMPTFDSMTYQIIEKMKGKLSEGIKREIEGVGLKTM